MKLSRRQSEALEDWLDGVPFATIARLRKCCVSTAATHRKRLKAKIKVRTQLEAWHWWQKHETK